MRKESQESSEKKANKVFLCAAKQAGHEPRIRAAFVWPVDSAQENIRRTDSI